MGQEKSLSSQNKKFLTLPVLCLRLQIFLKVILQCCGSDHRFLQKSSLNVWNLFCKILIVWEDPDPSYLNLASGSTCFAFLMRLYPIVFIYSWSLQYPPSPWLRSSYWYNTFVSQSLKTFSLLTPVSFLTIPIPTVNF